MRPLELRHDLALRQRSDAARVPTPKSVREALHGVGAASTRASPARCRRARSGPPRWRGPSGARSPRGFTDAQPAPLLDARPAWSHGEQRGETLPGRGPRAVHSLSAPTRRGGASARRKRNGDDPAAPLRDQEDADPGAVRRVRTATAPCQRSSKGSARIDAPAPSDRSRWEAATAIGVRAGSAHGGALGLGERARASRRSGPGPGAMRAGRETALRSRPARPSSSTRFAAELEDRAPALGAPRGRQGDRRARRSSPFRGTSQPPRECRRASHVPPSSQESCAQMRSGARVERIADRRGPRLPGRGASSAILLGSAASSKRWPVGARGPGRVGVA